MRKRNRSKTLVIGVALAVATLVAACNPMTNTAYFPNYPGAAPESRSNKFLYRGPAPAWIQVRVVAPTTQRITIEARTNDPDAFCIGDGAYGSDVWVPCGQSNDLRLSPARAVVTEGQARGWKKLVAINPVKWFGYTVRGAAPGAQVTVEVMAVDGNGNRIGEFEEILGVGP